MTDEHHEPAGFRLGLFSTGDLISLGAVVFFAGALWLQVGILAADQQRLEELHRAEMERIHNRLTSLEQVIPSEYVRRQDYREDVREIKELLQRLELKIDGKVDRSAR